MNIYIKNMVSLRCKMIVIRELEMKNIKYIFIELGLVEILGGISLKLKRELTENLAKWGLELLEDKKLILVEKIINVVIEMVHYCEEIPRINYSDYLSKKLGYDYTYLSNIFSETKRVTIQHFIIIHKIERVKELLEYNDLNLTEISNKLEYSSVAHLSNQFKKITGITPSVFKQLQQGKRVGLENV